MDGNCCTPGNTWFIGISQTLDRILCHIQDNGIDLTSLDNVARMLATNNPMSIAAEFPKAYADRFVVETPVRFLDMLNTNIIVVFKIDNNDYELPMYFKDAIGYEHPIVFGTTPVKVNQIQLNGMYKANYQYSGGYIILDSLIPLNPDIIPTTGRSAKIDIPYSVKR